MRKSIQMLLFCSAMGLGLMIGQCSVEGGDCPIPRPVQPGVYEILSVVYHELGWDPVVEKNVQPTGTIRVDSDWVTLRYTDRFGAD